MQVFQKGAKAGDAACERGLRTIMKEAASVHAMTVPMELAHAAVASDKGT